MKARQDYAEAESPSAIRYVSLFLFRYRLLVLLAVLALIALFRIAALALNGTDLYMDEAQYWAWAQNPSFGYYSKPPLIAWIIHTGTGLCGDGEACIRLPATLLHLVTAILLFFIGRRLYSADAGLLAASAYAMLPAVSLSSGIVSTDVPLLTAWALALYAFVRLLEAPTWSASLLLALALGIGLNAKYAMAYFVLSAAIYFAVEREARSRLGSPHVWVALVGGFALLIPNLLWNLDNDFATVSHTAENAAWSGLPFHPEKAAEFLLSQFGVFGPILFAALLMVVWRAAKSWSATPAPDRLLLCFALPILILVTTQAFISRAHPNWAAPAYVAGVLLVTAVMIRDRAWGWMRASFALHAVVALLLAIAAWQAGRLTWPVIGEPFSRSLGNHEVAEAVRAEVARAAQAGRPFASILTDSRDGAAALAYYGRDLTLPVLAWRHGNRTRSHFELVHPFDATSPQPALLVSALARPRFLDAFRSVAPLGARSVTTGADETRSIHLFRLDRLKQR